MPVTKWPDYRRHWNMCNVTTLFSLQERYRVFNMPILLFTSFSDKASYCACSKKMNPIVGIIPWDGHMIDLIFSLFSLQVLNYSSSL